MQDFQELKLSPEVARAVKALGFTTPTPIQAQALPILLGKPTDFVGLSATGTGKTVAYGIPLVEGLNPALRVTQAIVLCPTRELAVQVTEHLKQLGQFKAIDVRAIYGGTGYSEQLYAIRQGTPILVATPGRLVDHLRQGNISLKSVKTVVLDEADEMLSMGFQEDLEFILKGVDAARTWLFSATMNPQVRRVAEQFLNKPKVSEINRETVLSGTVKQIAYTVRDKNKPRAMCRVIDATDDFYGLIFCQTRALVVELTGFLLERGYKVDCLHGDKGQRERLTTLNNFRSRNVNILVASDVAARGLDVKELTHVINYSLPADLEAYVHRIGRTARSGKTGIALSLVAPDEMHLIARIERITRSKIELGLLPGRKVVAEKSLARFRTRFETASEVESYKSSLGAEWEALLKDKTPEEIAARFLCLLAPNLFEDREKNEGMSSDLDENPRHQNRPWQSTRRSRSTPSRIPARRFGARIRSNEGNWDRNREGYGRGRPQASGYRGPRGFRSGQGPSRPQGRRDPHGTRSHRTPATHGAR